MARSTTSSYPTSRPAESKPIRFTSGARPGAGSLPKVNVWGTIIFVLTVTVMVLFLWSQKRRQRKVGI